MRMIFDFMKCALLLALVLQFLTCNRVQQSRISPGRNSRRSRRPATSGQRRSVVQTTRWRRPAGEKTDRRSI